MKKFALATCILLSASACQHASSGSATKSEESERGPCSEGEHFLEFEQMHGTIQFKKQVCIAQGIANSFIRFLRVEIHDPHASIPTDQQNLILEGDGIANSIQVTTAHHNWGDTTTIKTEYATYFWVAAHPLMQTPSKFTATYKSGEVFELLL
ncbi:MAG: hypothetical protein AB7T49_06985 [Oligoflexales bacterium]